MVPIGQPIRSLAFFVMASASSAVYTLSLHDALPISRGRPAEAARSASRPDPPSGRPRQADRWADLRSEEHTSELQSRPHLVCRLLLEKKKDQAPAVCSVAGAKDCWTRWETSLS